MKLYESKLATVYHGKCEDFLEEFDRRGIDLIATDPPYGVRFRSNVGKNFDYLRGDDGKLDVTGILAAYTNRVLRVHRHVYVFGSEYETLREPLSFGGCCELIWDKCNKGTGNLQIPWGPTHERIAFGVFTPSESGRNRGDGKLSARMRSSSVISVPRKNATAVTKHPTEKPVGLMTQLIESSSLYGDTVLDMFAGSGSTGVAAILAGRRTVMIEEDEQYAHLAAERVRQAEKLRAELDKA